MKKTGTTIRCQNCLEEGHNIRSCTNETKVPPPKVWRNPGRPRTNPVVQRGGGRGNASGGRGNARGGRGTGRGGRGTARGGRGTARGKIPKGIGVTFDPQSGEALIGGIGGHWNPAWPNDVPLPSSTIETQMKEGTNVPQSATQESFNVEAHMNDTFASQNSVNEEAEIMENIIKVKAECMTESSTGAGSIIEEANDPEGMTEKDIQAGVEALLWPKEREGATDHEK